VIRSVELSLRGERVYNIQLALEKENIKTQRSTIRKWIDRFEANMKKYGNQIDMPIISTKNKTKKINEINEIYERAKSDMNYLFSLLDDGTKIWIAQEGWIKQDALSLMDRKQ
jgi:hypothetical protein